MSGTRHLPPHVELPVHGFTINGCGIAALHHVGRGRYLRRYAGRWTRGPTVIPPSLVFLTETLARQASRHAHETRPQ